MKPDIARVRCVCGKVREVKMDGTATTCVCGAALTIKKRAAGMVQPMAQVADAVNLAKFKYLRPKVVGWKWTEAE